MPVFLSQALCSRHLGRFMEDPHLAGPASFRVQSSSLVSLIPCYRVSVFSLPLMDIVPESQFAVTARQEESAVIMSLITDIASFT